MPARPLPSWVTVPVMWTTNGSVTLAVEVPLSTVTVDASLSSYWKPDVLYQPSAYTPAGPPNQTR